jgi:starch synthase
MGPEPRDAGGDLGGLDRGGAEPGKGRNLYSNFVTSVSRGHAWEACYSDQGRGRAHPSRPRQQVRWVLNGVDYDTWNPESDPWTPQRYAPDSIDQKYVNKHALRRALHVAR